MIRQLKVIHYIQTQVSEQQSVNYTSRKSLNRAGRRVVRRGRSRSRVEDIGSPAIAAPSDAHRSSSRRRLSSYVVDLGTALRR